jgi:ABC-type phosphate transport system permease subunit
MINSIAMASVIFIGIIVAIIINEYLSIKIKQQIKHFISLFASFPTVLFGALGAYFFINTLNISSDFSKVIVAGIILG